MQDRFDYLCENFGIYKQTKREFYPKQISFSPQFINALYEEYKKQKIDENTGHPINNHREKFLKAMRFHLREFENGTVPALQEMAGTESQKKQLKKLENQKKAAEAKTPKARAKILKSNMTPGVD